MNVTKLNLILGFIKILLSFVSQKRKNNYEEDLTCCDLPNRMYWL